MNYDVILELTEEGLMNGVSTAEINKLIDLALDYKNNSTKYFSDSDLKEVIEEAFNRLDESYEIRPGIPNSRKTTTDAFYEALRVLGYSGSRSK